MFQFPFFFFPPPSDAVMAESETPKVTTPIARTSRRARLRNWLWLFSFCFLNLISVYLWKYFLSVMKYYTCWFLFYFHSFNIGTWHQSKLGMMMCKDTKSSRLLINLVLFFIKKRKKPPCLSFIPLLKCVKACESAGLCRVNLWHHYKQFWMSACIMFGQRCLMGCHSLHRQYYYLLLLHMVPYFTFLSSLFLSYVVFNNFRFQSFSDDHIPRQ